MSESETSDQGNMVSQREGEWVLVPREPTEAMLTAAHDAWGHVLVKQAAGWPEWAFIYSEMIAAAPPPEPRADEGGVSQSQPIFGSVPLPTREAVRPVRVQLKRTKGWKMPPSTEKVIAQPGGAIHGLPVTPGG